MYIHVYIPYIHGKIHGKPIYIYIPYIYIYTHIFLYVSPFTAIGSIGNSSLFDHPFWESPIVGILAAEQTTSHIKNPHTMLQAGARELAIYVGLELV